MTAHRGLPETQIRVGFCSYVGTARTTNRSPRKGIKLYFLIKLLQAFIRGPTMQPSSGVSDPGTSETIDNIRINLGMGLKYQKCPTTRALPFFPFSPQPHPPFNNNNKKIDKNFQFSSESSSSLSFQHKRDHAISRHQYQNLRAPRDVPRPGHRTSKTCTFFRRARRHACHFFLANNSLFIYLL